MQEREYLPRERPEKDPEPFRLRFKMEIENRNQLRTEREQLIAQMRTVPSLHRTPLRTAKVGRRGDEGEAAGRREMPDA